MTLSFLDRLRLRRETAPPPVFEGLPQVRAYWEGLRDGGQLPQRAALDPRGLSGVLDRVFLGQRIGRGLVQVRVAGSALAEFSGMDVRGLPLSCLFAAESRERLSSLIESTLHTPSITELDLGSDRAAGGGLAARMLLLPLAEERGTKLVLGAVSFYGTAPTRCKLHLRSAREERVLLPAVSPVEPVAQPIRRYGHLSLVHVSE